MGPYFGDYKFGQTVRFMFDTNDRNGAAIAPSVAGTVRVYKNNSTTERTAGITVSNGFDSVTGVHLVEIDTSDSFYVPHEDYHVVLQGATIDSQAVNAVLGSFSVENRGLAGVLTGTVAAASPTPSTTKIGSTVLSNSDDDRYVGGVIVFTTGALKDVPGRKITDSAASDQSVTISDPWPTAPTAGDHFMILGLIL